MIISYQQKIQVHARCDGLKCKEEFSGLITQCDSNSHPYTTVREHLLHELGWSERKSMGKVFCPRCTCDRLTEPERIWSVDKIQLFKDYIYSQNGKLHMDIPDESILFEEIEKLSTLDSFDFSGMILKLVQCGSVKVKSQETILYRIDIVSMKDPIRMLTDTISVARHDDGKFTVGVHE